MDDAGRVDIDGRGVRMNRRRIGIAALVVGVGAVVRQRMRTRVDPGPDLAATVGSGADGVSGGSLTVDPGRDLAATVGSGADGVSGGSLTVDPGRDLAATVGSGADGVSGGSLTVDPGPDLAATVGSGADGVSDGSLTVDPGLDVATAAASSLVDPGRDVVVATPSSVELGVGDGVTGVAPVADSVDVAATRAQVVSVSDEDVDPAPMIKLPTMPQAGTQVDDHAKPEPAAAQTRATISPPTTASATALSATPPSTTLPLPAANDATDTVTPQSMVTSDVETAPTGPRYAPAADSVSVRDEPPAPPDLPPGDSGNNPPLPPSKEPFYRANRGWGIAASLVLGLLVAAVIAASVVRLPYYSLQPGSVYDTIERVEAPGDLVSIPNGEIGFVTVAQTANITALQWLDAKLDNTVQIRHEDEVRGDQTADEFREADIRRMQISKDSAVVVALQKLGFDLIITPIGIEVAQIFDCTAADGTLGTGDLIVGVNGVDVRSGEQLVEQLMGQSVGDEVDLLIERIDPNNPTQSMSTDLVAITLGSADADCLPDDVRAEEPRPFIGIGTLPMFDEEFPIDIDLRTGPVSGPSAGLAFTLAIMDVLSEGELTNGLSVVATGSIDREGNVGPVGGIHQKTVAAERSGADVFLVPKCCDNFVNRDSGEPLDIPSNYEEALLYADDMIVIGVDTLDEALIALGELGGDVEPFLDQATP